MTKKHRLVLWFLIILSAMLVIPGCSSPKTPEKKPNTAIGQKPKAPPALQNIRTSIDQIISGAEQKRQRPGTSPVQASTKLEPGSQEQKKGKPKKPQPGAKTSDWKKESDNLKKIHENWNALEPEAVRAGLSTASRNNFEDALDNLTQEISNRRPEGTLLAAIALYGRYADLAQVFATPLPPDYFRLKYEAMAAGAQAGRDEWLSAKDHTTRAREYWDHLKVQAQSIDPKLVNRTEFSVQDLQQAAAKEQAELCMIKVEILLKNLEKLEREFSRKSSG